MSKIKLEAANRLAANEVVMATDKRFTDALRLLQNGGAAKMVKSNVGAGDPDDLEDGPSVGDLSFAAFLVSPGYALESKYLKDLSTLLYKYDWSFAVGTVANKTYIVIGDNAIDSFPIGAFI